MLLDFSPVCSIGGSQFAHSFSLLSDIKRGILYGVGITRSVERLVKDLERESACTQVKSMLCWIATIGLVQHAVPLCNYTHACQYIPSPLRKVLKP
jgi:hypothetical protein